ncbi:MAG: tRNA (adenosine(37)-N6)-dimethylallyltransferase MiaA [Acutalibacteraceae bacterium]
MSSIKTVFIVGPTASGKTALGISLAERFSGEVVSADSMQIYKGIHIASAAPETQEMREIPHHLLEFLEPQESFSVADYVKAARGIIKDIENRGKLPIAVGGTGLYISSLADNTEYTEEQTDYELRQSLENRFDQIGAEQMLRELAEFDPDTAARLHPNNRRRIIRAFEVYRTTGKTVTEQNAASHTGEKYIKPLLIGITYRDRDKLYERINRRVDIMLENGLLEEAKTALLNKGGAVQAIGHKELSGFIEGKCSLEEATENLKRQTRRYAKRQLTWFNRDKRIHWIYADETEDAAACAAEITEKFLEREEA